MTERTRIRVPHGSSIASVRGYRSRLSPEEIAALKTEDEALRKRCREIFNRVYPELVRSHYDWFILIEPNSGDYFIDADEGVASQKGHQKHPTALMLMMRLNETGTCGRI